jgi:putative endonuclease
VATRKRTAKSKPAAFVYVLGSFHKGRYTSYVGWTNDVTQRLAKHNNGTGALDARAGLDTSAHRTIQDAQ